MNQQGKLQLQLKALQRAHDALLHEQPSDMVALAEVASQIIAVSRELMALSDGGDIPPVSEEDEQALRAAADALQEAIDDSAGSQAILEGVTNLLSL